MMTVKELRNQLVSMPDEAEVWIVYESGMASDEVDEIRLIQADYEHPRRVQIVGEH